MMQNLKSNSLKVLTLNLHAGVNWYGQYDLDGIIALIKNTNPDLCGFQEVDRHLAWRSRFQDLAKILARDLEMDSHFTASLTFGIGSFGNLILSKYPILERWSQQVPGKKETRSFCSARIVFGGVKLHFITTHLGLTEEERACQVSRIQQFLCQCTGPVILTGDFNCGPEEAAVQTLTAGLKDLQKVSGLEQLGTFRLNDGQIGPRIDYILATSEFGVKNFQVLDTYVSDHLPVVALLSLMAPDEKTTVQTVFCQNSRL